jgi:hypothetical protein
LSIQKGDLKMEIVLLIAVVAFGAAWYFNRNVLRTTEKDNESETPLVKLDQAPSDIDQRLWERSVANVGKDFTPAEIDAGKDLEAQAAVEGAGMVSIPAAPAKKPRAKKAPAKAPVKKAPAKKAPAKAPRKTTVK